MPHLPGLGDRDGDGRGLGAGHAPTIPLRVCRRLRRPSRSRPGRGRVSPARAGRGARSTGRAPDRRRRPRRGRR
ncbi:hypothetical protein [Ornithinimicrobium kibberense]|uniref:hypothetical protein n=1 Tax=Ornithinimicrobium kibberense TaxID=282060 RepID=UPI003620D651